MPISHIHSFLVQARKGFDEPRQIGGVQLQLEGRLFELLNDVYQRSVTECDVDIYFQPTADGDQQNICRDLIITHLKRPTITTARTLAKRLEEATDRRSGLGLFFLIVGKERANKKRIVLSRFPTDEAILAEETEETLSVQFLERVFLKNKFSYKAAMYEDTDLTRGMWMGSAVDKQNGDYSATPFSNYWVGDFLASDLSVTPAYGTRRMGVAIREAAKKVDLNVKREIITAATLATGLRGQRISIAAFEDKFNLSDEAKSAINREIRMPQALSERFRFDEEVFNSIAGFRSIELNNGGVLTASSANFDKVFRQENIPKGVRITTEGEIVVEKLKKSL